MLALGRKMATGPRMPSHKKVLDTSYVSDTGLSSKDSRVLGGRHDPCPQEAYSLDDRKTVQAGGWAIALGRNGEHNLASSI